MMMNIPGHKWVPSDQLMVADAWRLKNGRKKREQEEEEEEEGIAATARENQSHDFGLAEKNVG